MGLSTFDSYSSTPHEQGAFATWIKNEMFVVVNGKGRGRHDTAFVEVGKRADS